MGSGGSINRPIAPNNPGADVAAVDFQVGQTETGEVADLAEVAAKVLQSDQKLLLRAIRYLAWQEHADFDYARGRAYRAALGANVGVRYSW